MPDGITYYWLYNEDMTKFIRFAVTTIDEMVDVREYKIQKKKNTRTVEDAGCPIEPDWSTDVDCGMGYSLAQEHWMELVRKGYRMMVDTFGRIEHQAGMTTCWITLNSTRKVNYS